MRPTSADITKSGIEITAELLEELKKELMGVFDFGHLEAAYQRDLAGAGTKEYAWVYRPEIPLLLQGYRDCDAWAAACRRQEPPPNIGAFGPFVRLGLALRFATRLHGGTERIADLGKLAKASDFQQLTNKAFELETAFFFAQPLGNADISFGNIGGNPDLWLAPGHPLAIPLECKVVTGGRRPSPRCRGEWRRFIVWTVKQMRKRGVAAGICLRARDDFGPDSTSLLQDLARSLLEELATVQDETWAYRSDKAGEFLMYGIRLCQWDTPRGPIDVSLGLDGEVAFWVRHNIQANDVRQPYFFALKFQGPTLKVDAVADNFRDAAEQIKGIRPTGPGVVVLKVDPPRTGDLYEMDQAIRTSLARRPFVSAVTLLWDQGVKVPDEGAGDGHVVYGFSLTPYVITNGAASVKTAWPDSKAQYFPQPPMAVLRTPTGELVPFDFTAEETLLKQGSTLSTVQHGEMPVLLDVREGKPVPTFPHIVPEKDGLTESNGAMTFMFKFRESIASSLLKPEEGKEIILEWFVVGKTHFRIYRDRDLNLRINRRGALWQENVAIDLPPFGKSDTLLLQLTWSLDGFAASLTNSDDYPAAVCRAVRLTVD